MFHMITVFKMDQCLELDNIISSGNIIGAVGASAGTVEQDIAVAEAARAGLVV
jgi:hypothetical protein